MVVINCMKFKFLFFLMISLTLVGCAPYSHWPEKNYAYNDGDGLFVMSFIMDPDSEFSDHRVSMYIMDVTPYSSNRKRYDRARVNLIRSDIDPERFALGRAPFGGRTRDDLVILKLPPGDYIIADISFTGGGWITSFEFEKAQYNFSIKPEETLYAGSMHLEMQEMAQEKYEMHEEKGLLTVINNLKEEDLSRFYETMKNINKESITINPLKLTKGNLTEIRAASFGLSE